MLRQAAIVLAFVVAPSATALTLADASGIVGNGRTRVAGVYTASRVSYEVDGLPRDVERRLVGTEMSHGIAKVDVFAQVGVITSAKMNVVVPDGEGYVFGGGLRAEPFRLDRTALVVHAVYTRQREVLTGTEDEIVIASEEVHAGATLKRGYNSYVVPYIGVEVVPENAGKRTTKNKASSVVVEEEMKRDGILNGRVGCNFQLTTGLSLRPELVAGGERTLSFTGGYAF